MKKRIYLLVCLCVSIVILVGCGQGGAEDIKRAEEWKDKYPAIYESYLKNKEMHKTKFGGSEPIDYLAEHPNLRTFYDGYGFSKEYHRARGHIYALEDVIEVTRPKPGASCLTCKTATFTEELNKDGIEVNKINFDEFVAAHPNAEGVSCYDCHRNTPGEINITRAHLTDALTDAKKEVEAANLVCAQCHVEYYQNKETVAVILPWDNGLNTDGMLKYYDDIDFYDWEHPITGAKLLKAQHPEFETYYDSLHYNMGLSCIDCHMPEETVEGENIKSHHWTSPLLSDQNLTKSCLSCHSGDPKELITKVEEVQKSVTDKTNEVSGELKDFIDRFGKALEDGNMKDEDIQKLRDIHRNAQFKWDFVFVENSEGFHNSSKAHQNLDEARALIKEGILILESYGK